MAFLCVNHTMFPLIRSHCATWHKDFSAILARVARKFHGVLLHCKAGPPGCHSPRQAMPSVTKTTQEETPLYVQANCMPPKWCCKALGNWRHYGSTVVKSIIWVAFSLFVCMLVFSMLSHVHLLPKHCCKGLGIDNPRTTSFSPSAPILSCPF